MLKSVGVYFLLSPEHLIQYEMGTHLEMAEMLTVCPSFPSYFWSVKSILRTPPLVLRRDPRGCLPMDGITFYITAIKRAQYFIIMPAIQNLAETHTYRSVPFC